jgi:hypothetical protein
MKKFIVTLLLVAVACAPAMAAVTVCSEKSGTTVTVKYTTDANTVRAFALDMTVGSGTITAVNCSNSGYYVYPGSIQIQSGSISSYGRCDCNAVTFPGITKPGIGSSGVTVEMGSLYTGTNKPASTGTLLAFTISDSAATVTLARNTARGGVVMERAEETPTVTLTTCVTDCYPSGMSDYATWVTLGKPSCWCFPRQCHGDADGQLESPDGKTFYHVAYNDLNILLANWKDKAGIPAGVCADMDHLTESPDGKTWYHVAYNDLNVLLANWKDVGGAPADCTTPP